MHGLACVCVCVCGGGGGSVGNAEDAHVFVIDDWLHSK